MKNIYSLLVAAVMMIGATACQQDAVEGVKNEKPSFTATLNGTRTELGENNKVMWNADDKITIYTQENKTGVVFDGDATEATATAKFTTTKEFAASETGYFAVYPYGKMANSYSSDIEVPVATYADKVWSIPTYICEEQMGVIGSYDERQNYMVAYSNNDKLAFKAATALIKFNYTGTEGYAGLQAQGSALVGSNTLNYNTTTGELYYEETNTFTTAYLNDLVQGETYYIPIYPGTISSLAITDGWQTILFSHEGEYTFEAGKIYNITIAETTPSPYTLMDQIGMVNISMLIDEETGYHYAKNVTWAENLFFYAENINGGDAMISASTTLVAGEWQATQNPTISGFAMPEGDMFDVYLSSDASQMCVVPAGEPAPSQYHLYAYNSSAWSKVNAYVWDAASTTLNGLWPGKAMTKTMVGEVEYYVYDIPNKYIGQQINFIFNSGTGSQTADLSATVNGDLFYYTNGEVVEDPANPIIPEAKKLYLVPNSNWKKDNARFAAYFFGANATWVDMNDEDKDGIYECELPEGYPNVIFCRMSPDAAENDWNNKWNQTEDLTVPTDGTNCYTVKEGSWDKGGGTWSTYTK